MKPTPLGNLLLSMASMKRPAKHRSTKKSNTGSEFKLAQIINYYLYQTSGRTKAVNKLFGKLSRKIDSMRPSIDAEEFSSVNKVVIDSWNSLFDKDEGVVVSIGLLVQRLYEADTKYLNILVGARVWEEALDSYYFANDEEEDRVFIENQTNALAEAILGNLGYDTSSKLLAIKQKIKLEANLENRSIE